MLLLESQSSLGQRKVSCAPTPESFSVPGRKVHLKPEEVIFLQEREFCLRSSLDKYQHALPKGENATLVYFSHNIIQ